MKNNRKNTMTKIEDIWKTQQDFNEIHYLPKGMAAILLIIAFTCSDFLFIKQIVEYYFTEAEWMIYVSAAIISILIDVSPSILAACIMKKPKKRIDYIGIGVTLTLLALMFILIGGLRINSADLMFSTNSTTLRSAVSEMAGPAVTPGQAWISAVYVVIPVFTSVLSFLIAVMDNNASRVTYADKMAGGSLYDQITQMEAEQIEIGHVLNKDFDSYVDEMEAIALSNNEAENVIALEKLKLAQAMHTGDPQAASEIMARKIG